MGETGPPEWTLGPLEARIMQLIWEMGDSIQVDDVHRVLQTERQIAYTTVMTVMSRLAARGLLERSRQGRAYLYSARVARDHVAQSSLNQWLQRYWGGRVMPAVSFLLGSERLSPDDLQRLRELVQRLSGEGGDSQ